MNESCRQVCSAAVTGAKAYLNSVAAYLDSKHDIDGSNDIVLLGIDSPCSVDHGVWGTPLLSKVHDCIWLEAGENVFQELPVADVSNLQVDVVA